MYRQGERRVNFTGTSMRGRRLHRHVVQQPDCGDVYAGGDETRWKSFVISWWPYVAQTGEHSVFSQSSIGGTVHTMDYVYANGGPAGIVKEDYYPSYNFTDSVKEGGGFSTSTPDWPLPDTAGFDSLKISNSRKTYSISDTNTTVTATVSNTQRIDVSNWGTEPMIVYLQTSGFTIDALNVNGKSPVYLFLKSSATNTITAINNYGSGSLFIIGQSSSNFVYDGYDSVPETYLYVPGGNVKFNNYVALPQDRGCTQSNFNQLQGFAIGTSSA
jgi:hypothetical protein